MIRAGEQNSRGSTEGQLLWPRLMMGHSQGKEGSDGCPGRRCPVSPGEAVACVRTDIYVSHPSGGQPSRARGHAGCLGGKTAHQATFAAFLGTDTWSGLNVSSGSLSLPVRMRISTLAPWLLLNLKGGVGSVIPCESEGMRTWSFYSGLCLDQDLSPFS